MDGLPIARDTGPLVFLGDGTVPIQKSPLEEEVYFRYNVERKKEKRQSAWQSIACNECSFLDQRMISRRAFVCTTMQRSGLDPSIKPL